MITLCGLTCSLRIWATRILIALGCSMMLFTGKPAHADAPVFWLAPPDKRGDFHEFFEHPELWSQSARKTDTFSLNAPYLLSSPPETVKRQVAVLKSLGIKISVSIASLRA